MKKSKFTLLFCVLFVAGLVSACSATAPVTANPPPATPAVMATSQPISQPAATATNPQSAVQAGGSSACGLLTTDQVGATLGKTGVTAAASGMGSLPGCTYTAGNLSLELDVTPNTKSLDPIKASLGAKAQTVSGLGEDAFINVNTSSLDVLKGNNDYGFFLTDSNGTLTDQQKTDMEKALAQQLLSNLH